MGSVLSAMNFKVVASLLLLGLAMVEAMGPRPCSNGKPTSCTCPDGSTKTGSEVRRRMCGSGTPPTSCTCSDGSIVSPPCGGERPSSCTAGMEQLALESFAVDVEIGQPSAPAQMDQLLNHPRNQTDPLEDLEEGDTAEVNDPAAALVQMEPLAQGGDAVDLETDQLNAHAQMVLLLLLPRGDPEEAESCVR